MDKYTETNREDMIGESMVTDVPVAQTAENEADKLNPYCGAESDSDNYLLIIFDKPYNFDGDIFNELDLSGMEDINGRQLTAIEKAFCKTGVISTTPETTSTYAKIIATAVTGLPAEFFEDLPGKEIRKIKTAVTRFFYGED